MKKFILSLEEYFRRMFFEQPIQVVLAISCAPSRSGWAPFPVTLQRNVAELKRGHGDPRGRAWT
jgi:hypothetical protein